MSSKRESQYQSELTKRICRRFPGAVVLKQDANLRQGIPDLLVLWRWCWAALEVKISAAADQQPNQEFYVSQLDEMSFSAFIYPENEEAVLNELQQEFESRWEARLS